MCVCVYMNTYVYIKQKVLTSRPFILECIKQFTQTLLPSLTLCAWKGAGWFPKPPPPSPPHTQKNKTICVFWQCEFVIVFCSSLFPKVWYICDLTIFLDLFILASLSSVFLFLYSAAMGVVKELCIQAGCGRNWVAIFACMCVVFNGMWYNNFELSFSKFSGGNQVERH